MAKEIGDSGFKGTPAYCSPEVFKEEYSKGGDVYSFGFVVYEIVTNKIPFNEIKNINEIYTEVVNKGNRPIIEESVPDCYRNLIECCWSQNENERPSFSQIIDLLKTETGFITENVLKSDYMKYIEFIDKCESNIDTNNFEEFINSSLETKIDENEPDISNN
ncbi:hypothetical protein M9Y10_016995 [Tritrichomonas musculus]|uniref:Protein kinase domain-containing protein n=1 Tax=Tritrichomonas musculus TaxID=1915356 RepID=A0ABR2HXR6_9EUKA